jgi:hypothetical protein
MQPFASAIGLVLGSFGLVLAGIALFASVVLV